MILKIIYFVTEEDVYMCATPRIYCPSSPYYSMYVCEQCVPAGGRGQGRSIVYSPCLVLYTTASCYARTYVS
jgi:hypothetical protein